MSVYGRVHSHAPPAVSSEGDKEDDDWDTDPSYVNDVSEKQQRWGSKLIQPDKSSVAEKAGTMDGLREQVISQDKKVSQEEYEKKKQLYGGERAATGSKD
eukprot:TRINITY_DN4990_c0_g1_i1.p1 TRINITY_DN4990_c0_g1~~TRINITY_DN4990_c0_g1_i1.p1  ORF type:complete len:100 (-),score=35.90 TRINITY_DN4990_c0_g1_i1:92-391(-)